MPVWASPRGIAEKHQKAWLKVVCCNLPDAGLQVYAIRLSSRPDKLAQPGAPYFMPDAARTPYPAYRITRQTSYAR
ncbi:hypothetical protein GFZ84_04720 [Escherichia coli]|nr:hypothetical protein [Escherichia coli]